MAGDLERAIAATRRSYETLHAGSTRHAREWSTLRPQGDQGLYSDLIHESDWRGLGRAGNAKLTEYRKIARQLVAYREVVAKQFSVNDAVSPVFEREFVPPRSRPDWTELTRGVREELTHRGRSRRQIAKAIADLSSIRNDTVPREHRAALLSTEEFLSPLARQCFAGLMGAHLATTVATFNRAAKSHTQAPRDSAGFAQRTLALVDKTERGYWRTLHGGRIPAVDLGPSDVLANRLSEACTHAAHLAVRRRYRSATPAEHRAALAMGDALRALLRLYALRYQLVWLGAAHPKSPDVSEWMRSAALPFASAARSPRRASLANLAARPRDVPTGTKLTAEGLLVSLDIKHIARKPISIATLRDAKGHEIAIGAKYRKIDSSGMVPGSYVRVAGEWTQRMPEFGRPTLNVDRLALNELAEASWTDWVTARVRGTFEPSPQALAAHWSWQLGRNGAGNQLRYRVWFAPPRRP